MKGTWYAGVGLHEENEIGIFRHKLIQTQDPGHYH